MGERRSLVSYYTLITTAVEFTAPIFGASLCAMDFNYITDVVCVRIFESFSLVTRFLVRLYLCSLLCIYVLRFFVVINKVHNEALSAVVNASHWVVGCLSFGWRVYCTHGVF